MQGRRANSALECNSNDSQAEDIGNRSDRNRGNLVSDDFGNDAEHGKPLVDKDAITAKGGREIIQQQNQRIKKSKVSKSMENRNETILDIASKYVGGTLYEPFLGTKSKDHQDCKTSEIGSPNLKEEVATSQEVILQRSREEIEAELGAMYALTSAADIVEGYYDPDEEEHDDEKINQAAVDVMCHPMPTNDTSAGRAGGNNITAPVQAGKRPRLIWTQELHNRFINALTNLVSGN